MVTYTFEISDVEKKAVEHYVVNFEDWIQEAITNKVYQRENAIIKEHTTHNPLKLTKVEKEDIINGLTLESRKERDLRERV